MGLSHMGSAVRPGHLCPPEHSSEARVPLPPQSTADPEPLNTSSSWGLTGRFTDKESKGCGPRTHVCAHTETHVYTLTETHTHAYICTCLHRDTHGHAYTHTDTLAELAALLGSKPASLD